MLSQKEAPRIAWKTLEMGELIGNGSFGDVHKGRWNGRQVAVKLLQMKTLSPHLAEDFEQEAHIMMQCECPHVLTLHGVCAEPGHYGMVMEYMPNGSLYQFLHNPKEDLSPQLRWEIAMDIAQGLSYLHSQNILHRDLKSFNVLLDNQYRAKISDFGLAKLKLESSSTTTSRLSSRSGTVRWRAPELFKRKAVATKETDMYSYGMVLWELVTRELPFKHASDEPTVIRWVVDQGKKEEIPKECPEVFKKIIEACWSAPESRLSAAHVVSLLEAARPRPAVLPKAWHFAESLKPDKPVKGPVLLPAAKEDFQKVLKFYQPYAVPGYEVKSVEIIYNPIFNRSFCLKMEMLQARDNKSAFAPKWLTEGNSAERALRKTIEQQWTTLAAPHQDSDYPAVKLLPLWHGTKPEVLDSIFETGYANLATTDAGFFGKGIYSSHEAEYAYRVYSQGALIFNWVATFSAYPVIKDDMPKLAEKGNYQNYDTHFAPVRPKDPSDLGEVNYYPCSPGEKPQYTEVVVFDTAQCLPRYLVTLQAMLSKQIRQQGPEPDKAAVSDPASSSGATVLQFTPPPKKVVIAPVMPKVNPQELTAFLCLVAKGEQGKAEAMLKQTPELALVPGDVTDLSERTFRNITAFQYAVWALDWHMWTMLLQYLPPEKAKSQAQEIETGSWVATFGLHANWQNLLDAQKTYLDNYKTWSQSECQRHWIQVIGKQQLLLPAHVINEYCHPTRSFSPCPDFTKLEPDDTWRTRKIDDGEWFSAKHNRGTLGVGFAVWRENSAVRAIAGGKLVGYWPKPSSTIIDYPVVSKLFDVRQQQRADLLEWALGQNSTLTKTDPFILMKSDPLIGSDCKSGPKVY